MSKLEPESSGRRRFTASLASGAAASVGATPSPRRVRPRVIIVGGGAGGASAAQQLALHATDALDITLIERSARYVSCFHSNLYLGGLRDLRSLTHDYRQLPARRGIRVLAAEVQGIDRAARQVRLAGGRAGRLRSAPALARYRCHPWERAGLLGGVFARGAAWLERGGSAERAAATLRGSEERRPGDHRGTARSVSMPARAV